MTFEKKISEKRQPCRPGNIQEQVYYDDEIDLADLLAVLYRRRIFIAVIISVFLLLAVFYCFTATKKYEVTAQIRPGITGYDNNGKKLRDVTPEAITTWFSKKVYERYLSRDKKRGTPIPVIKASSKRSSDVILLTTYYPDPAKGTNFLQNVLECFIKELNKNLGGNIAITREMLLEHRRAIEVQIERIAIQRLDILAQIDQKQHELKVAETELQAIAVNKQQTQAVIKRIKAQLEKVIQNTNELMDLRKNLIKETTDKFSMLMYANIFQQNISYVTTLEQRLSQLKKEINKYEVDEAEKKMEIAQIQAEMRELGIKKDRELPIRQKSLEGKIKVLETKAAALSPLEILQSPYSSDQPARPRVKLIIALSIVIGLMLGVFGAFFREFLDKNRENIEEHPNY